MEPQKDFRKDKIETDGKRLVKALFREEKAGSSKDRHDLFIFEGNRHNYKQCYYDTSKKYIDLYLIFSERFQTPHT